MKTEASRQWWQVLLCAGLVVLVSQVSVALLDDGFHISVAVVLFQVLLFLSPELPVLPVTLLAASGVFLLRLAVQLLLGGTLAGCWKAHAPEMLFYLCYGLLFHALFRRKRKQSYRFAFCLPLAAIDALSNLMELLVRMGLRTFSPMLLLQITAVGLVRALLAGIILLALDRYGLQLLHREDSERYQQLLLMTADLRSEVVWMEKGASLAEQTMNGAYHLSRRLRSEGADPALVDAALTIAKDIHEVKKDYALVMRGISGALEQDTVRQGMELQELFRILARSTEQFARAAGKDTVLTCRCGVDLRTTRYYELMSIFRNLLNNAVEAAPAGRPVHLALTVDAEVDALRFVVEDDCGGIPADRLDQIFTPGFSSKINRETGEINRGLGLAIVRDLAEDRLGGAVSVESADGHTTFTVLIPICSLEESSNADLSD